ncbi:putative membrane protein [Lachnotalea glycerini]|uniref:Putative membrane protein n=1 Tax=Lachnotalea glycerini TaxID=1763509 RepID=A0A318EYM0_9FIRM|nr:exopolysaccharide Pel transporter PelG [Lachnotalea glycerini]PXV96186.1 putative membrane protein [Lachnotalea glycerini]
MAGVGFELRKLFKENSGYVDTMKAYATSAVVTEGPMVLSIVMLSGQRLLMKSGGSSYNKMEIFVLIMTYSMIFSMLISNILNLFLSRFISDCIFEKKYDKIMSAFFEAAAILLCLGGIIGYLYLASVDLKLEYKILAMAQFSTMIILWIEMCFLSALRKYIEILKSFVISVLLSFIITVLLMLLKFDPLFASLSGTSIAYFIMLCGFLKEMIKYYPFKKISLFVFFKDLDKYPSLCIIGFFMTLGLYGHNFVMWSSEYKTVVIEKMVYCVIYDIPCFFAALTIIPMLVLFTVSLEVNFYEKYKGYFSTVLYGGRLEDIKVARKGMVKMILRELSYILEVQLFIAIIAVVFIANLLKMVGMDINMIGIFQILCFGYCFFGLMRCIIIVLLYFDDRIGAAVTSVTFAVLSIAGTFITLRFGIRFYGVGFVGAAILASIYAIIRLFTFVKNLEYNVFCKQPLFFEEKRGIFTKLAEKIGN